jgi:hypothetical protein
VNGAETARFTTCGITILAKVLQAAQQAFLVLWLLPHKMRASLKLSLARGMQPGLCLAVTTRLKERREGTLGVQSWKLEGGTAGERMKGNFR